MSLSEVGISHPLSLLYPASSAYMPPDPMFMSAYDHTPVQSRDVIFTL